MILNEWRIEFKSKLMEWLLHLNLNLNIALIHRKYKKPQLDIYNKQTPFRTSKKVFLTSFSTDSDSIPYIANCNSQLITANLKRY